MNPPRHHGQSEGQGAKHRVKIRLAEPFGSELKAELLTAEAETKTVGIRFQLLCFFFLTPKTLLVICPTAGEQDQF